LKRLERLKRDHLIHAPRAMRQLSLRFQDSRRSGDIILQTEDLVVGYSPKAPLFRADDIDFRRTECAALIGPNGSGKTTFLKTILGEVASLGGRLRHGASLEVGYFAQAHDALDMEAGRTVLEELLYHHPMLTSEARDYLARFLFTGDDVFKPLPALSGGERGRLALALLMRERVNFLLLDEPTNHLDIPAQEVLEDVINEFDGTVILVSHDRYLVSRLATQIWALEGDRLRVYKGNYEAYVATREREAAERAEATPSRRSARRSSKRESPEAALARAARQAAQRTAELEESVHRLEARLAGLSSELAEASQRQAFDQIRQLTLQYNTVEAELEQTMSEWAQVASSHEED
jgi:ATP-binding cassette subfamily F protein 3